MFIELFLAVFTIKIMHTSKIVQTNRGNPLPPNQIIAVCLLVLYCIFVWQYYWTIVIMYMQFHFYEASSSIKSKNVHRIHLLLLVIKNLLSFRERVSQHSPFTWYLACGQKFGEKASKGSLFQMSIYILPVQVNAIVCVIAWNKDIVENISPLSHWV